MIILLALSGFARLYPQQPSIIDFLSGCQKKYGSDVDLVNGEKYFYPYARSQGNPFFFSDTRRAVITIHEKEFKGEMLRYDLFNQQLVLDYTDIFGATSSLVLQSEWVESFAFEEYLFRRMQGPEGERAFFQIVTDGPVGCLYSWRKDYLLNLTSGVQSYYFTDPARESFLMIGGQFYAYRNNANFMKIFDPGLQKKIRLFMRQSKINVKKASDSQMRLLVEYCNSLSHDS